MEMVAPTDSTTRLCSHSCHSAHTGSDRHHLPLCLMRVTHAGTADGTVRPTPGLSADGSLQPRNCSRRPIYRSEIRSHMNPESDRGSRLTSVATWSLLSSLIYKWQEQGVRDLRVHVIFTPLFSKDTQVYKATGLAEHHSLNQECYCGEEYLIRGRIRPDAIIKSFPVEGKGVLMNIPLFGYQSPFSSVRGDSVPVALPAAFFAMQDDISDPDYELVDFVQNPAARLQFGSTKEVLCRVLLDMLSRGCLFSVTDWQRLTHVQPMPSDEPFGLRYKWLGHEGDNFVACTLLV
ncbi:hypothetical protein BDV25DRAFT_141343 [Aspergillus avenaceus]|uniref:Uncharacterized protein n=1 Tax=Aspergillus avenaceus TaxID=36643 RepID=A0A5N6TRJ1_ASPAV|nr:hypothetical protein BDV25DRAFT_141343 [Aspergillus avenaceus]